jgi:hypothetical protein
LGHNLGLHHAAEGTNQYGDQTSLMGYSYHSDTTRMCFNPAKSWQLGWYSLRSHSLNLSFSAAFDGSIVGIIDYQKADAADKFVDVRIAGSTEGTFVGFNLDAGFNSGTKEALNEVTVHTQAGNGLSYLVAKMVAPTQTLIETIGNGVFRKEKSRGCSCKRTCKDLPPR